MKMVGKIRDGDEILWAFFPARLESVKRRRLFDSSRSGFHRMKSYKSGVKGAEPLKIG